LEKRQSAAAANLKAGEVPLLSENLRFHPEEESVMLLCKKNYD
jgi:3-phosphoglycerate kinase